MLTQKRYDRLARQIPDKNVESRHVLLATPTVKRPRIRPRTRSLHLVLVRTLGRFPVGLANRSSPNLLGPVWVWNQQNYLEITVDREVLRVYTAAAPRPSTEEKPT